jgi:pilus assembly protein Flp/PilA
VVSPGKEKGVRRLSTLIKTFVLGEDGPAAVEYAVMLALIVAVCVATIGLLGIKTQVVCDAICTALGKK